MKIRILKNVLVEVEKPRLQETWDITLRRWDEINVENISYNGKYADIRTWDGDIIYRVPTYAFEILL